MSEPNEELSISHGDGSYIKFVKSLRKPLSSGWTIGDSRHWPPSIADLLEILDDRVNTGATLIASKLPVHTSRAYLGGAQLADANLDLLDGSLTPDVETDPPVITIA